MTKIYKYKLETYVVMPRGSIVLSVGVQYGELYVWAQSEHSQLVRHFFLILHTGEEMPETVGKFVGTVQFSAGSEVHVFDLGEQS